MKELLYKLMIGMLLCILIVPAAYGQEVTGPHRIKWIRVGSLHSWFSNCGAELEYGRRGRACCQEFDQADNFYWDAQFEYQDRVCSKGLWVGCLNFDDPVAGKVFDQKVISAGPRFANVLTLTMPVEFKMVGRFEHPTVFVDGMPASDNILNDVTDEIDANIKADRMIISEFHTPIGLTITRKIYGFSQQYHDNYFITEYVIKNTGIINLEGTTINETLEGVVFHLSERYAPGFTSHLGGWEVSGNSSWGANTAHQVIGTDPDDPAFSYRAYYSWYHPHSASPGFDEDWGNPDHRAARTLGAPAFIGGVTLHTDAAPDDPADDPWQPFGTMIIDSDQLVTSNIDQYSRSVMTDKYNFMTAGHMEVTHADMLGDQFGDKGSSAINGWDQCQNYGPYTLAPGDSFRVVQAEGVAGLNRALSEEIGRKWFYEDAPFDMPNGSTSNDRNAYKKEWVWTAEDSMMQMYARATANFQSGFDIPQPPPPPDYFEVNSGGDKITLTWSENAMSDAHFDGYRLYRAINRPDTLYDLIFSCDASDVVHEYQDETALRGFDYYYYIVTKDDGSLNDISPGTPLVSSKFWTMTNTPAYLRRPAGLLIEEVRVVPNPFHVRARDIQFGNDTPDRIAFYEIPAKCKLKIYTERGDLIWEKEHADGSGDELWDSLTSSRQVVVSGVYILYVEVTEDIYAEDDIYARRDFYDPKHVERSYVDGYYQYSSGGEPIYHQGDLMFSAGELIHSKGESVYRKFVIIR